MSEILEKKLARANARIRTLEAMIENQTRDLFRANERLGRVLETVHGALFVIDVEHRIVLSNRAACELVGLSKESLQGQPLLRFFREDAKPLLGDLLRKPVEHVELELIPRAGAALPVLLSANPLHRENGAVEGAVCIGIDLTQRRQLEAKLRQAQRLESIGQLAAGIAHEINTPIQFVGDSAQFLEEAWEDLQQVLEAARALRAAAVAAAEAFAGEDARRGPDPRANADVAAAIGALDAASEKLAAASGTADLAFLEAEIPTSIERMKGGVSRVSTIVSAMKIFSHPGGRELAPADLNRAIETTLVVARNEYKYVANVELELGPIPEVYCEIGDLNQVLLNVIVNAAHAIDARRQGAGMGTLRIATRPSGDHVVIEIADDGCGIPEAIRERIFDPFFTTKEVGRGTGQGLAIARGVVERHGGEILCTSEVGVGTTFTIVLPLRPEDD